MAHFKLDHGIGYLNGLVIVPLSFKLGQRQCCLAGVANLPAVPVGMIVLIIVIACEHANVRLVQLDCLAFLRYSLFDHF